jgi:hypothetical protein
MTSFYKDWDITPFKIRYRFVKYFAKLLVKYIGGDSSVDIANMRRPERSADGIPMAVRFTAPVQIEPGANPAFSTIQIESLNIQ